MPALLSFSAALRVDILIWTFWSTAAGWWVSRRPDAVMEHDGWITRLRPWEREGRAYVRLGIRRWKGHLPDMAPLFGGRSKQLHGRGDPDGWRTLAADTRRAEQAHWLTMLALPVEAVIRSGVILVPMVAYAVIANGPCIAAQRHNRGRLVALLAARRRRSQQPGRGRSSSSSCRMPSAPRPDRPG